MRLFDEGHRQRVGPARHGERDYSYLNESGEPVAGRVRDAVESWFTDYPERSKSALAGRIRSRSDVDFQSATFELALLQFFTSLGFQLDALEPPMENGRSPDFRFRDGTVSFYVEAVISSDVDDVRRGEMARLEAAIQALDEARSPRYHLSISRNGYPATPVPLADMRRNLQAWIDALSDHEQPGLNRWTYSFAGMDLEVEVLAARRQVREVERAFGAHFGEVRTCAPHEAIRATLLRKANRYGDLNAPFVIAVNCLDDAQDRSDYVSALFGTEVYCVPIGGDEVGEGHCDRLPDGLWRDARRPRRQRVSAVLFFDRFSVWTASRRQPVLALNPWATHELPSTFGLTAARVVDREIQFQEGPTLGEVLGLDADWPRAD